MQWCKEWGLPEPAYEEAGSSFVTVFHNPAEGVSFPMAREKTVEKILLLIGANPKISQKEIMVKTGLTRRGVEWNLKKLKREGRLRRIGPDKGGHWKVIQ